MSNSITAHRWTELQTFSVEIDSGPDQLFANGRQQLKLRVGIRAISEAGTPVTLTQREINSIKLVETKGGKAVPEINPFFETPLVQSQGEWGWSKHHNPMFDYYRGGARSFGLETHLASSNNTQYVYFYMRSIARTPKSFSATVRRDDGNEFSSEDRDKGDVTLSPVPVPNYRKGDYTFEFVKIPLSSFNPFVEYNYYKLTMAAPHSGLDFLACQFVDTRGLYTVFGPRAGTIVGISSYTNPNVMYSRPQEISHTLVPPAHRAKGQIVFVWHRVEPHIVRGWWRDYTNFTANRVYALDTQGNDHNIGIRFVPTDRDWRTLELI